MKKALSIGAVLCLFLVVFYFDSTEDEGHHPSARILDAEERTQEAASSSGEEDSMTETSHEYLFEESKEKDGLVIETYQEYKMVFDENGNEIKREPTGNFDYLRYQK